MGILFTLTLAFSFAFPSFVTAVGVTTSCWRRLGARRRRSFVLELGIMPTFGACLRVVAPFA